LDTLEQIEKLRTIANVSYEEAKDALEAANGNLLDAVIYLEKQGKVEPPSGGGFYSSEKKTTAGTSNKSKNWEEKNSNSDKESSLISFLKKLWEFCLKMIRKGNRNTFEVLKNGETKAYFPVTILALLLIFAFWATLPLIIIGLFLGFRYRFTGPDIKEQTINETIENAAKAVENFKKDNF
jgi:hypothetical protein